MALTQKISARGYPLAETSKAYDISLIGTAEQLRELIDKLERCYKSIIEFQNSKDKESESK